MFAIDSFHLPIFIFFLRPGKFDSQFIVQHQLILHAGGRALCIIHLVHIGNGREGGPLTKAYLRPPYTVAPLRKCQI